MRWKLLLGLLLFALIAGCGSDGLFKTSTKIEGLPFQFAMVRGEKSSLKTMKLADLAGKKAEERLTAVWGKDGELAPMQAREGTFTVSGDLYNLFEQAMYVQRWSKGQWNPLFGAVEPLWDKKGKEPAADQLQPVLETAKVSKLVLHGDGQVEKQGAAEMSFRRLAIGWAIDGAVQVLKDGGIESGSVSAADLTYCWGTKSATEKWNYEIHYPSDGDTIFYKASPPSGGFCLLDGTVDKPLRGLHTLINPETGYPIASTSVVMIWNPSAALAGGFAEAGLLMGKKDLFAMVKTLPPSDSLGVLYLYKDGENYIAETDQILMQTEAIELVMRDKD